MNTQKTHEFKVVVFEDKAGLRFVHCDQAYAAISGPGETDTVIAEFSNAEFPAVAINAEMLQALKDLRDCIESGREPSLSDANSAIRKAESWAS